MLNFLKNAPIRRKIISIVMIICTAVVFLAYCIIAYTQWQSRHQLLNDSLSTLTHVIGINSGASLAFSDPETAEEILSALKSEQQIISADLLFPNGQLLAGYKTDLLMTHSFFYHAVKKIQDNFKFLLPETSTNELETIKYESDYLEITQKIHVGNRLVGNIQLRACLHELYDSLIQQLLLVGGLLLLTLLIGYLLANKLQTFISSPVLHLANIMQKVSNSQDYSIRASANSTDELGSLIHGFNNMLDTVQQHDNRLSQVNKWLKNANEEAKSAKIAAEQANQSKSDFLANMSHELRTPMHAILSFSHIGLKKLEQVPLTKLGDYFSNIAQSGNRLLALLNDLLDLSKLESGKMEFSFADGDLAKIIDLCTREQDAQMQEQGITLNIAPNECDTNGVFDQVKIGQVITNLLSNSIKFTPKGKEIFISVVEDSLLTGRRKDDQRLCKALRLIVRDQGIGIPESEFDDVFDKFIQSSKTKPGAGGTGLGLAICKEIIEGHHGRIWVEKSADSDGAVFSFIIPVNCADFFE